MTEALLWAVFGMLCLAVPTIAYAGWTMSKPWVHIGNTTDNDPILAKFDRNRHMVAEVFVSQQTGDLDDKFEREFGEV